MIHEDMRSFYNGFPRDAHPMAILSSVVGALATFYKDSLDPQDPRQVEISIHRLLAKLPTIAAYSYKKSIGQPFIYPRNSLAYCENFLRMMFAVPSEEYEIDPDFVEALNLLLIVHADQPTSTVRMVGSSNANLFASISAGICALWGPLHGGANEAVVNMLEQIIADGCDVQKYIDLAKDKKSNFRLMGFGHRVYKNYDPRATIIKKACDKLLAKLRIDDPLFDVAQRLEGAALSDPYFVERRLYPNVDFYSGASSTARSESPFRCLPFCSRWGGCPAGSRTGAKCTVRKTNASPGPGRSTPDRRCADSSLLKNADPIGTRFPIDRSACDSPDLGVPRCGHP